MQLRLTYIQGKMKLYHQSDYYNSNPKEIKVEEFLKGLSPDFKNYAESFLEHLKTNMEAIQNNNEHTTPRLEMRVELLMDVKK